MAPRRRIALVLLAPLGLLALAVGANRLINQAQYWHAPPPGRFYLVEGRPMHLYCAGSGAPAVVLESGLGDDWLIWQRIQPNLSRYATTCSYDRAGLGWSAPHPGRRDATEIAAQLDQLLLAAGLTEPIVLVGHSAGGLFARRFAAAFPSHLAALVLLDGTPPESFQQIPTTREPPETKAQRTRQAFWRRVSVTLGWARLTGSCQREPPPGLEPYTAWFQAETCRPRYAQSWVAEANAFELSGAEVAMDTLPKDLPLLILSQDPDRPKPGWSQAESAANPTWAALQEGQRRLSSNSRRVIAIGSGHRIQLDRPDLVIAELRALLQHLRAHPPAPFASPVTERR